MPELHKVQFLPDKHEVFVEKGTRLLDAAFQAGISVDALCGGRGKCGKCRMEVLQGGKTGICLGCETIVEEDMIVRVLRQQKEERILSDSLKQDISVDSGLKVVEVTIEPICPGEAESVWERVRKKIQKTTGRSEIETDISVLTNLYHTLLKGGYRVFAVLYEKYLLDVCVNRPSAMLFAVDIGTTTLVGYLLDGITGKLCSTVSEMNPQCRYGADVITRAAYVKENGMAEMSDCIRACISSMLTEAAEQAGVSPENVYVTVLAGNTCMHHLFLGISPESLVHAPYSPVIRERMEKRQREFLASGAEGGRLKFLPNIAGFVGADTAACLLACGFKEEQELTLLMDIGTNGELVLGNRLRSAACSTAAGPAFEGAKIMCGMRGASGAIDHVSMKDGVLEYSVIGNVKPQGICGSGLMDLMAVLVAYGFVDSMGMLKAPEELTLKEAESNKWRILGEGINRKFILYGDGAEDASVYITQKDIGEIQLAKAAMAAGIRILCMHMGVHPDEIKKVLIAGAFGNYMNPQSACRIGLIPAQLEDKIIMKGNAAGAGAMMVAKNRKYWEDCLDLTDGIEFVELAAEEEFSDLFVEELAFQTEI